MYDKFEQQKPFALLDTSKYPPEVAGRFNSFITTQFDDSLSVEMQMRSIIKWAIDNFKEMDQTYNDFTEYILNGNINPFIEMLNDLIEYMNYFISEIDNRLTENIGDILSVWLNDGTLADIINEDVFDMKADKTFVDVELEKINTQLEHNAEKKRSNVNVRPFVTFTDDDGRAEVYSVLKPIFDAKGIVCSLAINSDAPGTHPNYMTWEQIRELYDSGWEITSHGTWQVNLNDIPEASVRTVLGQSKKAFENRGFDVKHFTYPYGLPNKKSQELVREYYESGINAQPGKTGYNKIPIKQFNVNRVPFGAYSNITLEEMKNHVDSAIRNNAWLIVEMHISETPLDKIEDIKELIDYIKSKPVEIGNYDDGYQIFGNDVFKGHYDGDFNNDKFRVVSKSGEVHSNHTTNVDNTTPITKFPYGFDIKNYLNADDSGFPSVLDAVGLTSGGSGNLITYHSEYHPELSYQYFKPLTNVDTSIVFYRKVKTNLTWTEWERLGNYIIDGNATFNFSSTPNQFPLNKTVTKTFLTTEAQGSPNNIGGVLTTTRFGGDDGFTKQIFMEYGNQLTFVRSGLNGTSWGAWKRIDNKHFDTHNKYTGTQQPSDFPKGEITTYTVGYPNGTGYPHNTSGMVTVYRPDRTDKGYARQEFRSMLKSDLYTRFEQADGTWSSWYQHNMELLV